MGRHQRKGHWSETWEHDETNPNLPWYHWALCIGSHWLADIFSLNVRFSTLSSAWDVVIQPWVSVLFFHLQYTRNLCAKDDGSSFDSGYYTLTWELVNHPCFLPKLAWTSWEMAFLIRSKQVTDFRLQSHSWNCEHWLSCGKIRSKKKLWNGPFPSLCYFPHALLWH